MLLGNYSKFITDGFQVKILTTNVWSSELSKLVSNAMPYEGYHQ